MPVPLNSACFLSTWLDEKTKNADFTVPGLATVLNAMSSSPCQYVPSTPCMCVGQCGRRWAEQNSPAAVVPEIRVNHAQIAPQRNSLNGLSTPIAEVPQTPIPSQVWIRKKPNTVQRPVQMREGNSVFSSPQVGHVAEQVVPSTPSSQGSSSGLVTATQTLPNFHPSSRNPPKPPRREAILKHRRSPEATCRKVSKHIDLFSNDEIFSK